MRILFLRGSIPPLDEHPEKLLYEHIEDCEDMWTQLFHSLVYMMGATGELIYQGGERKFRIDDRVVERWVPSIAEYRPESFDIIICRGGFPYYDPFVSRYPGSFKVYYGAGERYFPNGFKDYDLFLVDNHDQKMKVEKRTKAKVSLFVKPAASLFKPYLVEKKYDLCFVANEFQPFKGHEWLIRKLEGTGLTMLNIGNVKDSYVMLANELGVRATWAGWHLRKDLPELISSCKVGVVCSERKDSCPRVIPEYLACGLPVVVTDDVVFWKEKYINRRTGIVTSRDKFVFALHEALMRIDSFRTRDFYEKELAIPESAKGIMKDIGKKT